MELNEHIIQYLAFIEKRRLDKKTMKAYREDLRQFSDSTNGEYTEAKLLQYVNSLQEKYTAATAQRKVATLKAFLEYLYENGALKSNPLHKYNISFNRDKLPLDNSEMEKDIAEMLQCVYRQYTEESGEYKKQYALRNLLILLLMLNTGATPTEICNIKRKDVDVINSTIFLSGRRNRERKIAIHNNEVTDWLRTYYSYYDNSEYCEYFFTSRSGKKMSEAVIRSFFKSYSQSKRVTPSKLRPYFANKLYQKGENVAYITGVMGYSHISVTKNHLPNNENKIPMPILNSSLVQESDEKLEEKIDRFNAMYSYNLPSDYAKRLIKYLKGEVNIV